MNISRMISNWEALATPKLEQDQEQLSLPKLTPTRRCSNSETNSKEKPINFHDDSSEFMIDFSSVHEDNRESSYFKNNIEKENISVIDFTNELDIGRCKRSDLTTPNGRLTLTMNEITDLMNLDPFANEMNISNEDIAKNVPIPLTTEGIQPDDQKLNDKEATVFEDEITTSRKSSIQERRTMEKGVNLLNLPLEIFMPAFSARNTQQEDEILTNSQAPRSPALALIKKIFTRNDPADTSSSCSDSPKVSPSSGHNMEFSQSPNSKKDLRHSLQLSPDQRSPNGHNSPKSQSRFSFYLPKSVSPRGSRDTSPLSGCSYSGSPNTPSPLIKSFSSVSTSSPNSLVQQNLCSSDVSSQKPKYENSSTDSKGNKAVVQAKGKKLTYSKSSPSCSPNHQSVKKSNSSSKLSLKLTKKVKKSPDLRNCSSFPCENDVQFRSPNFKRNLVENDPVAQISDISGFKYYNPKDGKTSPAVLRKGVKYVEPVKITRYTSVPGNESTEKHVFQAQT